MRFFTGIQHKQPPILEVRAARINGLAGYVVHTTEGLETLAIETNMTQIVAIYAIRNPDKLGHLS
jgi:RNA polymerase sigma-70 factor (ECF subfamily)